MTEVKRAFSGKDVDMLTACCTLIERAEELKDELVKNRPKWVDPFFPDLSKRLYDAFPNLLGIDNAKELRQATQVVNQLHKTASRDIALFKVQVEEDFKNDKVRRNEILTLLGFTGLLRDAQRNSQQALIELLLTFKANMTPDLQKEITAAGMNGELITKITDYADQLNESNITQETLKGNRKMVSAEAVTELNGLYSEVISVARIATKIFKGDKTKQAAFSFSQIMKAQTLQTSRKMPPAAGSVQPGNGVQPPQG
jgi:hypothetical protein